MEEEMKMMNSEEWRRERFKGVVAQQNGLWGAQIYAKQQRIWLGTFKSAAMAYGSAALKLRNAGSHRNLPLTLLEPKFQSNLTTEAVLNMIRDGSYSSKFSDFQRSHQQQQSSIHAQSDGDFSRTLLFQKELTPSDVGKLNRLVIPKRYALKHFPTVPQGDMDEQVQLEFYDPMEVQILLLEEQPDTRGWSRFVKDKGLTSNHTIAFYMHHTPHFGKSFLLIDVASKPQSNHKSPKGFRLFGVQID